MPTLAPSPTVTPKPAAGTVTGQAVLKNGSPAPNCTALLLEVTKQEEGYTYFRVIGPSATTDADGHFAIKGVPPGKYMVAAFTGLIPQPGAEGYLAAGALPIHDVGPGQTIDVGTVTVN
jgi:hypothetical protein